jgi:hypothetical protein
MVTYTTLKHSIVEKMTLKVSMLMELMISLVSSKSFFIIFSPPPQIKKTNQKQKRNTKQNKTKR